MKILYICTHNCCRSILCEAITNQLAKGRISACSAGSQPTVKIHPLTFKFLQQRGIRTQGLKSQSWTDFEHIEPDLVITVCDNVANEACPVGFGKSIKVHWGLPDPSKLVGSNEEIREAFFGVMDTIENRIHKLLDMDIEGLSASKLQMALQNLAQEG